MPAVVLVACVDGDSILVLAGIGLLGLAQELIDNVPVSGEQAYLETLTGASFAKILPCPRDTHPVIVIDHAVGRVVCWQIGNRTSLPCGIGLARDDNRSVSVQAIIFARDLNLAGLSPSGLERKPDHHPVVRNVVVVEMNGQEKCR